MSDFRRLNREDFVKAQLKKQEIEVPELGGEVRIREMTAQERAQYVNLTLDPYTGRPDAERAIAAQAAVVCWCTIDDDGKAVFQPDDAPMLLERSGVVVGRIALAILRLSGLEASRQATPREEAAKNS